MKIQFEQTIYTNPHSQIHFSSYLVSRLFYGLIGNVWQYGILWSAKRIDCRYMKRCHDRLNRGNSFI